MKFPLDSEKGVLDLYKKIKESKVKFPHEPMYSQKIKYLIKKCLEKKPENRKTAEELLKMSIIHKREILDKFKPIFLQRCFSVDLPLYELAQGLDFFAEQWSVIFENPNDKNKPIVIYKQKKSAKKLKNSNNKNNDIIIKKEENILKREWSFLSVRSKIISEVSIIETVVETKIVNENGKEIEDDKNEGKYVPKRIISEK